MYVYVYIYIHALADLEWDTMLDDLLVRTSLYLYIHRHVYYIIYGFISIYI